MILIRDDNSPAGLQVLPGTFAGLMDLYERNYINMRRLIPIMPPAGIKLVSRVPEGLNLYLEVIERFRYTSELSLTYYFLKEGEFIAEPDLRIRVYHDARMSEVMSAHLRRWPAFEAEETSKTPLHVRWHMNRFLYKWLNYCLYQGHSFNL